jgi:hypothetical protein
MSSPAGRRASSASPASTKKRASYLRSRRPRLSNLEGKQIAWVFLPIKHFKDDNGEKDQPILRHATRMHGVWTTLSASVHSSPQEVWIFRTGHEPPELDAASTASTNSVIHGVWGYKPSAGPDTCPPEEIWFYAPQEPRPSYFTPQGIWMLPLVKQDGFVNVGVGHVYDILDVPGTWKFLYQQDGKEGNGVWKIRISQ